MKNITPSNPLKTFNDNKSFAVKKMGGAQVTFKKSLRKAQFGEETNDELINKPGSTGGYKAPMKKQYPWGAPVELNTPKSNYLDPSYAKDNIRIVNEKMFNDAIKNYSTNPQTGKVNYTGPKSIPIDKQKKGGVIKSLPKAQIGLIMNSIARAKKVYNMYNAAKQSSKLAKLPSAKKVKKSVITNSMLKSFNAIKNKKK